MPMSIRDHLPQDANTGTDAAVSPTPARRLSRKGRFTFGFGGFGDNLSINLYHKSYVFLVAV